MPKIESTTPEAIFAELRRIAPNIAFSVNWEGDPYHSWDGDGPDPREEGYEPHNVDVIAHAIVNGEDIEGRNNLGGVYDKPDERDPDIHGYLPQMLEEAAKELLTQLRDVVGLEESVDRQAIAASK